MKTKQITQGAMFCAIYGLILFLNQQTALFIESGLSWIFVFPILIYTAKSNSHSGFVCALAMGLETIFFGGFTTWFYSWTSLLTGFIYGVGIQKKWPGEIKIGATFLVTIISYTLIFFFWAKIFDFDYVADFEIIHTMIPFLDMSVFITLIILGLSILQTLCIHLIAALICIRMKIESAPIKKISEIQAPKWVGLFSILVFAVFFLSQNVIKCPQEIQDIILIIFFIDIILLDYYGTIYLLHRCCTTKKRLKWSFWICLGAFIPVLNGIWILLGELDCLLGLRLKEKE